MDAEQVRAIPLFASLSEDDARELASRVQHRSVGAGERLSTEGAAGYLFFVIEDGTAEVTHDGKVLARLGPGDFFGETAIVDNVRRTATVTAVEPMHVAIMFGADFAQLLREQPEIARRIEAALEARRGS